MDIDLTNVLDLEDCDVLMEREEAEQKFAEKMSSVVAVAGTYIREKNTIVIAAICKDPENVVREKLDDYPEDPIDPRELKDLKDLMDLKDLKDFNELKYLKDVKDLKDWKESKTLELPRKDKKNE
ncbi:unnamed protein product [Spodoptera exigua]|uniref:Uncharacterized protein n=1 Tax=Spodoptera exigua TaxID=7107 RepID=A0A835GRP9_SPOEX|nr:hypothetical protein HW555_002246 [Spodoptera exigua]KAH9642402.1 hypothetical protein HF086_004934 [Spodoptera exigua]CAH0703252.1 unnamed protein product [Spodoptera exigua]